MFFLQVIQRSAERSEITIPAVYREDYLGAIRKLTRSREPDTYIRILQRAQLFSITINGEDMDRMQNILTESNAFKEGEEYVLQIVRP